MTTKERYAGVIKWFQENKPIAETELQYHDPFQLLIAVILSAQCTDKRVNMITPALFEAFPTPQDLAAATPEEVYTYIKSVSYPNNKSKHLVGMARTLIEQFNGVVPSEIEDLQKLPGVGRKTANVIASYSRFQSLQQNRTHQPFKNSPRNRKNIGKKYSGTPTPHRTSLADSTRTLHLYGSQTQLLGMRNPPILQILQS